MSAKSGKKGRQMQFIDNLGFGDAKYLGPYGDPVAFKAAQNPHFDFEQPQAQS